MHKRKLWLWVVAGMFTLHAAAYSADYDDGLSHDLADGEVFNDPTVIIGGDTGNTVVNVGDALTTVDVDNNSDLTVTGKGSQSGELSVNNGGFKNNTNANAGFSAASDGGTGTGRLVINGGGQYTNDGTPASSATTVFYGTDDGLRGGQLNLLSGGSYVNSGITIFEAGSSFTGTGQFTNHGNLYVQTGMAGNSALDLLEHTRVGAGGTVYIEGSSGLFNTSGDFNHNDSTLNAKFVIATEGDFDNAFEVNSATLEIARGSGGAVSPITFNGKIQGANILITGRDASFAGDVQAVDTNSSTPGIFRVRSDGSNNSKATFTGSGSRFSAGNMQIYANNAVVFEDGAQFTSTGTLVNNGSATFKNNTVYAGGNITNTGDLAFESGAAYNSFGILTNNGGNVKFDAGSAYVSGSVVGNQGALYYDKGVIKFADLFNATELDNTGPAGSPNILYITGSDPDIANDIALVAGDVDSEVRITGGGGFAGVDVKSSSLTVTGSKLTTFGGNVSAGKILVENQGAVFQGAIAGDLTVVTTATITGTGSFGPGYNLTVDAGTSVLNNSGRIDIAHGGTSKNFVNHGTVNNLRDAGDVGVITIGTNGAFQNHGTFVNEGRFVNNTDLQNKIANTGTMRFTATAEYQRAVAGRWIQNSGTIEASANMADTDLLNLVNDLNMTASGKFIMKATNGNANLSNVYTFGQSVTGSKATIDGGDYTITMQTGSDFQAGNASLDLAGHVVMEDSSSMSTNYDFTVKETGILDLTQAGPITANISANQKTVVESGGQILIGQGNTLNITTSTAEFAKGSNVSVDVGGKLNVNGKLSFLDGSTMTITAGSAAGDVGQIIATGTVDLDGKVNVILNGTRDQFLNEYFLLSGTGTIDIDKLYNSLYTFVADPNGAGEKVRIGGYRSIIEVMDDALDGQLSINKINGGNYTDWVLGTDWGTNNVDLNNYIQIAGGMKGDNAYTAFGQLYGEYAAYASTALHNNVGGFLGAIRDQMVRYPGASTGEACYTTCVQVDECGNEVEVLAVSDGMGGGRGRVWAGGLGDWQTLDNHSRLSGYDYSSGGVIVGYDYAIDGMVVGFAGSYNYGTLKVDRFDTKIRSDMMTAALYGGYTHETGVFIRGAVGYARGWNEYDVAMLLGGEKRADYQNHAFIGALEIGFQLDVHNDFYMTPSVGIEFTHLRQDDWVEQITRSGAAPILANRYDETSQSVTDIPVRLAMGREIAGEGFTFRPEVHAGWIYRLSGRRSSVRMSYNGLTGGHGTMYAVGMSPNRGVVGASLTARFANGFDIAANYDYEFSGRYSNHNLTGRMGVSF